MFKLKSSFKPAGSQPAAVKEILESVNKWHHYQTLLGVTGSGKTFIMTNVVEKLTHSPR